MTILETPGNYAARQEFGRIAMEKFKDQAYWLCGNKLDVSLFLHDMENRFLELLAIPRDFEKEV